MVILYLNGRASQEAVRRHPPPGAGAPEPATSDRHRGAAVRRARVRRDLARRRGRRGRHGGADPVRRVRHQGQPARPRDRRRPRRGSPAGAGERARLRAADESRARPAPRAGHLRRPRSRGRRAGRRPPSPRGWRPAATQLSGNSWPSWTPSGCAAWPPRRATSPSRPSGPAAWPTASPKRHPRALWAFTRRSSTACCCVTGLEPGPLRVVAGPVLYPAAARPALTRWSAGRVRGLGAAR